MYIFIYLNLIISHDRIGSHTLLRISGSVNIFYFFSCIILYMAIYKGHLRVYLNKPHRYVYYVFIYIYILTRPSRLIVM